MRVVSIARDARSHMFPELELRDTINLDELQFKSIGWLIEDLMRTTDARVVSSAGTRVIHLTEYDKVYVAYDAVIVQIVDYAALVADEHFLLLEYNCRKWGYVPIAKGGKIVWTTRDGQSMVLTPSELRDVAKAALQRLLGQTVTIPYCR
jgi:hypothetical protein